MGVGEPAMIPFTHTHILSLSLTHTHLSQCQEEKATGTGKDESLEQIQRFALSRNMNNPC